MRFHIIASAFASILGITRASPAPEQTPFQSCTNRATRCNGAYLVEYCNNTKYIPYVFCIPPWHCGPTGPEDALCVIGLAEL
jgi:hypothetical protein